MAGLLLLIASDRRKPEHDRLFGALEHQMHRLVDGFEVEQAVGSNYRAAKFWLGHSRTTGFGRDERTDSWLAVVGNPTHRAIQTVPPTELPGHLLRLYLENGRTALVELNVPFVVVLYDGRAGSFHVATDRGGFQHLYEAEHGGARIFCTSSLALASVIPTELALGSVACYFQVGHLYGQGTFFDGVRKTNAATWLTVDGQGRRESRYWEPPAPSSEKRSIEDWAQELAERAQDAMEGVLGVGVPTTVELTGGRDSRFNLACALRTGHPFTAWTIAGPEAPDLRVIERLRAVRRFEHRTVSPLADLEEKFFEDLAEAHRLGDGEGNSLGHVASPCCNRQAASYRDQSVSGLGGEMFRGFYYISHLWRRQFDMDRLLSLQVVANSGFRPELLSPQIAADSREMLLGRLWPYFHRTDGMTLQWRLDHFYLSGRMQRFAGRSITGSNFRYREALPLFSNDLLDLSFRMPCLLKRGSLGLRYAMEESDPVLAAVPLATGERAGRPRSLDLEHQWARGWRLARRAWQKAAWRYFGVRQASRDEQGINAVVVRQLGSEKGQDLLAPQRMTSAPLYDRQELDGYLRRNRETGFPDRFQLGLILSMELTMRHVGSALRIPSELGSVRAAKGNETSVTDTPQSVVSSVAVQPTGMK